MKCNEKILKENLQTQYDIVQALKSKKKKKFNDFTYYM